MRCVIVGHPFFFAHVEQGKGERNIQQRSIHPRNESSHVECIDQHYPHGRTIMYMVTPATVASMMAIGLLAMIFDAAKNGLQLNDDSVMR